MTLDSQFLFPCPTTHLSKGSKAHAVQPTVVSIVDEKLSCPCVRSSSCIADCPWSSSSWSSWSTSLRSGRWSSPPSFCTSCIASNYWVVFDLVVKPVLILIGTTWNQSWSQPSIHNQWFLTYWSDLLGCLLLGKHGLVSFLMLGCLKQSHKNSVDLICQTGEQNLEQLWRERSGCRNRPGQEQRTGQHPGGRGTESPSIQMWADPRYQMYLNDDWRVTNIGDKLHSEKLRCRRVCSSRKEEAREEQQKQRCQRRHLVVCKTPAAWKNATVSKLSEIYFWTKGKL